MSARPSNLPDLTRRSRRSRRKSKREEDRRAPLRRRIAGLLAAVLCILLLGLPASAQNATDAQDAPADQNMAQDNNSFDPANPISWMNDAGGLLPSAQNSDSAEGDGDTASDGDDRQGFSATLSIIMLLTVLSLAPAILVMTTSFTRIVVVLALLRQAMGTQGLPPSQVIIGLSLFMTFLVMAPTFERVNEEALQPLQAGEIDEMQAWNRAKQPLRDFMFNQIDYADNWDHLYMVMNYRGVDTSSPGELKRGDVGTLSLVPAFILSELKVAFLMGFRLYLPFLIIDMVVASVLISMGMLMLPPVLISLPFKLLLFVLVDGWMLVAGNLLNSFAVPGVNG